MAVRPDPQFSRHVKETWPALSDLFRAGEAVSETVNTFGWTLVMDLLEKEIADVTAVLERDREPASRAAYAMAHGRIDGLRGARRAVEAVAAVHAAKLEEQRTRHEGDAESLPER